MIEHVRKAVQELACREGSLRERLAAARREIAVAMIQPDLLPEDVRPGLVAIDRELTSVEALGAGEMVRIADEIVELYASYSARLLS